MLIVSVANALEDGFKPLKLGVGAAGKGEKSCTASARNEPDTDPFFMVYSVGVPRSGKAQERACRATSFVSLVTLNHIKKKTCYWGVSLGGSVGRFVVSLPVHSLSIRFAVGKNPQCLNDLFRHL